MQVRTDARTVKAIRTNFGWMFYEVCGTREYFIGNQAARPDELPSCEKINKGLTPFGKYINVTVTMHDNYYNSPRYNTALPWTIE